MFVSKKGPILGFP